jgi:hypothetical protein
MATTAAEQRALDKAERRALRARFAKQLVASKYVGGCCRCCC